MTSTHHTLDYVELPAPDLAAAKEFFGSAFGWQFNDYGPPGEPAYVGIRAHEGDGEVGGLDPTGTPASAGPLVLLYADDLDATVQAVVDAGGRVLKEPYAFPGGRRFHFADPAGNELGAWSGS